MSGLSAGTVKGGVMATMEDVRRALWAAYKKQDATPDGIEGKSSEAWCELNYPTYWECETEVEFLNPCGVMVYSYARGPSRQHYFNVGKEDRQVNYYTWESPDPYAKAVEVIGQWANAISRD